MEQYIQDVLVGELYPGSELVVHRHVGPRPPVGDVPHPLEVHVHDPGVEARLSIKGNLNSFISKRRKLSGSSVTLLRGVS